MQLGVGGVSLYRRLELLGAVFGLNLATVLCWRSAVKSQEGDHVLILRHLDGREEIEVLFDKPTRDTC